MPGFEIIGTGHYVPGRPVANSDLARVMDTNDEWIFKRSGIKQRHYAPEGVGVSDLALEASRKAIAAAGIRAEEIDYIVFATMTPDHIFPGPGGLLAHKLGLHGVPALDIRQQCAAMIFGLQVISGLIQTRRGQDDPLRRRRGARRLHALGRLGRARSGERSRSDAGGQGAREQAPRARRPLRRRRGRAHLPRDRPRRGAPRVEGAHRRRGRQVPLRRGRRLSDAALLEAHRLRRAEVHPDDGRARALQVRGDEAARVRARAVRRDGDGHRVDRLVSGAPGQRAHQRVRPRAAGRAAREAPLEHRPLRQHQRRHAPHPHRRADTGRQAQAGPAVHAPRARRRASTGAARSCACSEVAGVGSR